MCSLCCKCKSQIWKYQYSWCWQTHRVRMIFIRASTTWPHPCTPRWGDDIAITTGVALGVVSPSMLNENPVIYVSPGEGPRLSGTLAGTPRYRPGRSAIEEGRHEGHPSCHQSARSSRRIPSPRCAQGLVARSQTLSLHKEPGPF